MLTRTHARLGLYTEVARAERLKRWRQRRARNMKHLVEHGMGIKYEVRKKLCLSKSRSSKGRFAKREPAQ